MSEHIGHFIDDLYSQNYIDKHTYLLLKPRNTLGSQNVLQIHNNFPKHLTYSKQL